MRANLRFFGVGESLSGREYPLNGRWTDVHLSGDMPDGMHGLPLVHHRPQLLNLNNNLQGNTAASVLGGSVAFYLLTFLYTGAVHPNNVTQALSILTARDVDRLAVDAERFERSPARISSLSFALGPNNVSISS